MTTAAHVVVHTVLEGAAARAPVRVRTAASLLWAGLEPLAGKVHILRVLLDLRVGSLLENVVLAVVYLVQQMLVINAKNLVLQKRSICFLILLL